MEPIKIAGLTLKSERKVEDVEEVDGVESEDVSGDILGTDESDFPVDRPPSINEELYSLIQRVVEELPKSDTNIKALAKLKGALELLS